MFNAFLENPLALVQTGSALATPLLVGYFGWRINKRLLQSKVLYLKDKEWSTKWAETFYSSARAFNKAVEEVASLVYQINEHSQFTSNVQIHQRIVAEKKELLVGARERVQQLEWALKADVQFAPQNLKKVESSTHKILALTTEFVHQGTGNLEVLRALLAEFNVAAKAAHKELMVLAREG